MKMMMRFAASEPAPLMNCDAANAAMPDMQKARHKR